MITAQEAVRKSQDIDNYLKEVSEHIEMACELGERSTYVKLYGNFNVDDLVLQIKAKGFHVYSSKVETINLPSKRVKKVELTISW